MVSHKGESLVYNIRLSSIGPSRVTGTNVVHEPTNMDLAMKLHYLKALYFFSTEAAHGLTIMRIKETMFSWLNNYYITCGRFWRAESGGGRPYMKCNDCGIRFIEAQCHKTIDEWLEMEDCYSLHNLLVYHIAIGPELPFSPPVFIQVTKFKCGGISIGFSWAHILGDPFSASDFFNNWGPYAYGLQPDGPGNLTKSLTPMEKPKNLPPAGKEPVSAKRVDPDGDLWITANNCKMESFSFHLTATQLSHLQSKISSQNYNDQITSFEYLCAIIWQCIAQIREGSDPKIITICKMDPYDHRKGKLGNNQSISAVKADFSTVDADLEKLAMLIHEQAVDERIQIEKAVERDNGASNFFVYGANLTFVDLGGANLYGLELKGHKPKFVYYTLQSIGDEGVVLSFPGPKDSVDHSGEGRVVTIILPQNEISKLKFELKKNGLLLESYLE